MLPALGWLNFSLIYYGFFLPNTKYAKLDAGIKEGRYFAHGISYLAKFALADPIIATAIITVIAFGVLRSRRLAHDPGDFTNAALLMLTLGGSLTVPMSHFGRGPRFLSVHVFTSVSGGLDFTRWYPAQPPIL